LALWIWNGLFIFFLVFSILILQAPFSPDPGAYPFYADVHQGWIEILSMLMLLFSGIITVDFFVMARDLAAMRPSWRALGGGFGLGSLFLLLMIFAHVFTTVYDYIPVVGPLFRDRFWLVYLVCSACMALPLLLARGELHKPITPGPPVHYGSLLMIIALAGYLGASMLSASPEPAPANPGSLRIFTYNIQQGYSEAGQRNYHGQLAVLRAADADLIGLQESDTNRIAGGNADLVRYLADRLDMYSYYGPSPVVGTFGIALLSRFPIENPRTFYMYSQGEQTAAITAQVTAGAHTFNIFVTHLGNGGPLIQQQHFLSEVTRKGDVIAMGDFNFRPDSEQYRLTTASLADAWLLKWPTGQDDEGTNPVDRIDHVFLSDGIKVMDAEYWVGPASDHPAVLVEIGW
jgi:endonuclease/exonuclease/phosphatase family metal-dependent hydrolase